MVADPHFVRGPAWELPLGPNEMAGIAIGNAFQVILMLRFGLPESAGRGDFSHHLALPKPRGVGVGNCVLCDPLLFFARVEDRRTITGSPVITLTVQRGRVVNLEEELQEPAVADRSGIKDNFDRFGMGSVIAVGCVEHVAPRITNPRGNNARVTAQ